MARRRHEEEHENHERWLVSYADFITLLFAFFVVMYAISSVNEGKYRVLSDSLVQAFRATSNESALQMVAPPRPGVTPIAGIAPQPQIQRQDPRQEAQRAEVRQTMRNMADEIRRVLAPLVRDGQVRVTEGANGIAIEINASALFAPAEASLGPDASRALYAVASVLSGGEFPIKVEGHTDSLPINTALFPSNWELSAVRASTVVRLFLAAGVAPARLAAAGYADQRPVADNALAEGRARNRRVTIIVESMLPEVEGATPVAPQISLDRPLRLNDADGALGTPGNTRLVPAATGSQ